MAIQNQVGTLPLWQTAIIAATTLILANAIIKAIYDIFFHPLARYPGPLLRKVSRIPWTISLWRNRAIYDVEEMHNRYGPVVRTAPGELSFQHQHVWRDIMGGGNSDIPKWEGMYGIPRFLPPHIQNTVNKDHHRVLRRALAPGFAESSLRSQEPTLQGHITRLIDRLRQGNGDYPDNNTINNTDAEKQKKGSVFDMEMWFRYVVLDIICDLALGESLDCISRDTVHPWIRGIESAGGAMGVLVAINMYPTLASVINYLIAKSARSAADFHSNLLKPAVQRRLEKGYGRPDLLNPLIKLQIEREERIKKGGSSGEEEKKQRMDELISNAQVIVGAGAETTATTLAAVVSLLLDRPEAMERIKAEVRGSFVSEEDITAEHVMASKNLPYLCACLNETFRLFPTTGTPSLRKTDQESTVICGEAVPKGTIVGIWTWGLYRSSKLWTDPEEFHPERWIEDDKEFARYANDSRETLKPFFTGSRDCIGQNLAVMELRLILARLIFNFDFQFSGSTADDQVAHEWTRKQKNIFIVWSKSPLPVRVIPRPIT